MIYRSLGESRAYESLVIFPELVGFQIFSWYQMIVAA